jgi:hypothetical protein
VSQRVSGAFTRGSVTLPTQEEIAKLKDTVASLQRQTNDAKAEAIAARDAMLAWKANCEAAEQKADDCQTR